MATTTTEVTQAPVSDMSAVSSVSVTPARIPGQPGAFTRREPTIIGGVAVLGVLAVWQAVASARVMPELFLPGPLDIGNAFGALIREGKLANDIWVSTQELILGFLLSVAVGLPLGLLMGWYKRFSFALDPFVSFFNATPRIALVPLLVIWFGIDMGSKIAIIFLSSVFPVVMNTMAGVRNLDPSLVKAARSFGASDWQFFRTVALPGAVPFILTGLRLAVGHALIAVVVGELVAARAGIGLMMATAGATFQTSRVFAGVIMVAGAGILLTFGISKLEAHFQSWRPRR